MKNLSFTKKLVSYFSLSLLVLLGIFFLIHTHTNSFIISARWVEHTNEVLLQNEKILNNVQEVSKSTRGYLLSGNEEFLNQHDRAQTLLPLSIILLKKITADNAGQQAKISLLETLIKSYVDFDKKLIVTRRQDGFAAADRLFVTLIGKNLLDKIQALVAEIEQAERTLLAERKINNERSRKKTTGLLVILEALIVSLLIVAFRIIYNNTKKRNKAELDLRRSNNFISSIINNSYNPISVRDLRGNYILVNDQFLKYVDLPRESVERTSFTNIFPPERYKRMKEAEHAVLSTKTSQLKEFKTLLKDGLHWYSSSTFPLLDENNNVYAICEVLTDVTAIKKSEEILNKNNQQLQLLLNRMQELLDTSLDVICTFDIEGRIIQISSACENLLGYKPEELIGQKYIDFVHPDDIATTHEVAESIMSGASVNDFENRYCRKDRSYVPVVWVAMWSAEEKLMYAIAKDRTKRQQTLEQLKYSEQNLANAQKIAMLGSWEIDFERRTVAGSEQFYKIVGKRKEEWGISVDDFYRIAHPADETVLKIAFEKAVREEGIWDVEFRIVQGNNNVIYVHAKAQIEFNKRKQPKRFKGTIQDITQRKKVEQERELVIQELTKSNADLKQFSFITSHNFRAPLCNILGILELMDYHNLDTNNKELLELLKAASLQLNKTIDDLTNILIIKNTVNDEISSLSFTGVYRKVEKVFSNALIEANGTVETDFKVPHVEFNPVYLENIFVNLVSNSLKYKSPDRSLRINISTKANKEGETVLTFSDNGIGIDLKMHREKIFGLYQRFHENHSGNGLGLFMIKSQINALHSQIEVESEVGKGTSFIITFKSLNNLQVYGMNKAQVENSKALANA